MALTQLALTILILLFSSSTYCAEIDSVTPRNIVLEDSRDAINMFINKRLQEGVDNANKPRVRFVQPTKEDYCSEEILYQELRKAIFDSITASWGFKGYSLDTQLREHLAEKSFSIPLKDSVYRDISYAEGFSLKVKELSDVVNINGHLIGLDKIGHFAAEGWAYFEMTHMDNQTIEQAMQWGIEREEGEFGYTTTGIYSYADLAANFNGWRFWNNILRVRQDPLKGPLARLFSSAYVGCGIKIMESFRSGSLVYAWKVKKRFDLADYLDGSWDEANNCVSYKNKQIEDKVLARMKDVDPEFRCPASPEICQNAKDRYGSYAKYILHPACLEK